MDVVGPVATDALGRELSRVESLRVTGLAGQGGMRASERKLRLAPVVEMHGLPAVGAVALPAIRAEAPHVNVVDTVTTVAVRRGALVAAIRVTQSTRDVAVLSLEGKAAAIVVEANLAPGRLPVTAPAVFSESSRVRVVVPVAGDAGPRGLPKLRTRSVAALAGNAHMGAVQR